MTRIYWYSYRPLTLGAVTFSGLFIVVLGVVLLTGFVGSPSLDFGIILIVLGAIWVGGGCAILFAYNQAPAGGFDARASWEADMLKDDPDSGGTEEYPSPPQQPLK